MNMQKKPKPAEQFAVFYNENCVICGADVPAESIGIIREHEYVTTDREFPVFQCPQCQCVYMNPRPDVSELGVLYSNDYYSNNLNLDGAEAEKKQSFVQRLFYRIHCDNYRRRLLPYLENRDETRPLRVLDVGCGVGAQLEAVREALGGNIETHGIELGERAADMAESRGHKVHRGRFEELELPEGHFDVVYSIHVIEHVERPDEFFRKCLSLVRPGGIVMIETPNVDCLDFHLLKKRHWGGYHAPRHWYLFRRETVVSMVDQTGTELVECKPYTMSNFWVWTCHSLAMSVMPKSWADALFPPVKVLYGGLQSFLLLSFFAVFERTLLLVTGKANSLWFVARTR